MSRGGGMIKDWIWRKKRLDSGLIRSRTRMGCNVRKGGWEGRREGARYWEHKKGEMVLYCTATYKKSQIWKYSALKPAIT